MKNVIQRIYNFVYILFSFYERHLFPTLLYHQKDFAYIIFNNTFTFNNNLSCMRGETTFRCGSREVRARARRKGTRRPSTRENSLFVSDDKYVAKCMRAGPEYIASSWCPLTHLWNSHCHTLSAVRPIITTLYELRGPHREPSPCQILNSVEIFLRLCVAN